MNIRSKYTDTIIALMKDSVAKGSPLNPPVWWIDPTDPVAHAIDDGKTLCFGQIHNTTEQSKDLTNASQSRTLPFKDNVDPAIVNSQILSETVFEINLLVFFF